MTTGLNDSQSVRKHLEEKLSNYFGVSPQDATIDQIYKAVSMSVVDILLQKKNCRTDVTVCPTDLYF